MASCERVMRGRPNKAVRKHRTCGGITVGGRGDLLMQREPYLMQQPVRRAFL